jgi:hypothetical protein
MYGLSPMDGDSMFLETLASTYESTRRQNPEEQQRLFIFVAVRTGNLTSSFVTISVT